MDLHLIRDRQEFSILSGEWNELLEASEQGNVFQQWHWLSTWLDIYASKCSILVIVLRDAGRLCAVFPLYIMERSGLFKGRVVRMIGDLYVGLDYLDFIIRKGWEEQAIDSLVACLETNIFPWDIIDLGSIPEQSKNLQIFRDRLTVGGLYHAVLASNRCPYAILPGTIENFIAGRSRSTQDKIKRVRRSYKKLGLSFTILQQKEELQEAVDALFALNVLRLRRKGICGAFQLESFRAFHSRLIPVLLEQGQLRMGILRNNQIIGTIYIIQHQQRFLYYQSGFDPQWERISPGDMMFVCSIEEAIREGMREYDFLRGEETYKYKWANAYRSNVNIKIFNRGVHGRFFRLQHGVVTAMKRSRAVLTRGGRIP